MTKPTLMVIFKAKAEHVDDVRSHLLAMIDPTRAEPGCESYVLHESTEGDGVFAFYETWTTQEHWATHMTQPHLTGLLETLPPMLDGDIQVRHLKIIA